MTIPLGLLYALIPVLVVGAMTFTAFIVTQLGRHAEFLAKTTTELTSQGDRIKRLEGWQDGVQFGRAVEAATHHGVE